MPKRREPQLPKAAGPTSRAEPMLPTAARNIAPPKSTRPITTFADLGMPFPLFQADFDIAVEWARATTCGFCATAVEHGFLVGEHQSFPSENTNKLVVPCAACGARNRFPVAAPKVQKVCGCGSKLAFPKRRGKKLFACYPCIQAGRVEFGHDRAPGDVQREDLAELERTPTFFANQGERWPNCCGRLMTYIGKWAPADFAVNAPDGDGQGLLARIIEPGTHAEIEVLWDALDAGWVDFNVFQCRLCGRLQANEDCD